MSKEDNIKFDVPIFTAYIVPYGYLDSNRESHALWYYYVVARQAYETHVLDQIVLEGDKDPVANFRQLFTSVARMYGVEPEAMAKCWDRIDAQCDLINCPRMPDEERYRFDRVQSIEITTRKPN